MFGHTLCTERKNRGPLTHLHLFAEIVYCNLVFLVSFVARLMEASESLSCDIICHLWCVETCRPDDRSDSLAESLDRQRDYHKRQLTSPTLSLTQFLIRWWRILYTPTTESHIILFRISFLHLILSPFIFHIFLLFFLCLMNIFNSFILFVFLHILLSFFLSFFLSFILSLF